jgi:K+-sensing histidine kinase KdpD
VAHDFNNVLTVIRLHTALLASEPLTETAKESVKGISLAGEHATTLTRQLLTFSRRQAVQMRELNLNDVIEGVIKMLRRLLGKSVVLQFTPGEIHPVLADAGMLEQVLMNLALNARDAMPEGGALNIHTGIETVSEAFARQNPEAAAGSFAWLEVADTGSGISPENLSKVFEPFFTTKELGKGTGLGLATVYGIVKASSTVARPLRSTCPPPARPAIQLRLRTLAEKLKEARKQSCWWKSNRWSARSCVTFWKAMAIKFSKRVPPRERSNCGRGTKAGSICCSRTSFCSVK